MFDIFGDVDFQQAHPKLTNCETIAGKLNNRNRGKKHTKLAHLPENSQKTAKKHAMPTKTKISKNFNEILGVSAADVFYLMGSTIKADNSRHQQAVE